MSVKIKICGITNPEDATWAANLGADFIGLNFWPQSPRKVSADQARKIVEKLPSFVQPVGVFVDTPPEEIVKIVKKTGLKGVQLHGDQTPETCQNLAGQLGSGVFLCKAFRVAAAEDMANMGAFKDICAYFLLDARVEEPAAVPAAEGEPPAAPVGGTGRTFPWELAAEAKTHGVPVFVAGGLIPENVREAVKKTQPFGVDVASGVEKSPKRKDYDKLKAFIEQAKRA